MTDYRGDAYEAKRIFESAIYHMRVDGKADLNELSRLFTDANRYWEFYVDAIHRRCAERDILIGRLLDELAERAGSEEGEGGS